MRVTTTPKKSMTGVALGSALGNFGFGSMDFVAKGLGDAWIKALPAERHMHDFKVPAAPADLPVGHEPVNVYYPCYGIDESDSMDWMSWQFELACDDLADNDIRLNSAPLVLKTVALLIRRSVELQKEHPNLFMMRRFRKFHRYIGTAIRGAIHVARKSGVDEDLLSALEESLELNEKMPDVVPPGWYDPIVSDFAEQAATQLYLIDELKFKTTPNNLEAEKNKSFKQIAERLKNSKPKENKNKDMIPYDPLEDAKFQDANPIDPDVIPPTEELKAVIDMWFKLGHRGFVGSVPLVDGSEFSFNAPFLTTEGRRYADLMIKNRSKFNVALTNEQLEDFFTSGKFNRAEALEMFSTMFTNDKPFRPNGSRGAESKLVLKVAAEWFDTNNKEAAANVRGRFLRHIASFERTVLRTKHSAPIVGLFAAFSEFSQINLSQDPESLEAVHLVYTYLEKELNDTRSFITQNYKALVAIDRLKMLRVRDVSAVLPNRNKDGKYVMRKKRSKQRWLTFPAMVENCINSKKCFLPEYYFTAYDRYNQLREGSATRQMVQACLESIKAAQMNGMDGTNPLIAQLYGLWQAAKVQGYGDEKRTARRVLFKESQPIRHFVALHYPEHSSLIQNFLDGYERNGFTPFDRSLIGEIAKLTWMFEQPKTFADADETELLANIWKSAKKYNVGALQEHDLPTSPYMRAVSEFNLFARNWAGGHTDEAAIDSRNIMLELLRTFASMANAEMDEATRTLLSIRFKDYIAMLKRYVTNNDAANAVWNGFIKSTFSKMEANKSLELDTLASSLAKNGKSEVTTPESS